MFFLGSVTGSAAACDARGALKAAISAGSESSLQTGDGLLLNDCALMAERNAVTREKLPALVSGAAMRTLDRCRHSGTSQASRDKNFKNFNTFSESGQGEATRPHLFCSGQSFVAGHRAFNVKETTSAS